MKTKGIILALLCILSTNMRSESGYHFKIDFSSESSDNIQGWTTNLRSGHPKGGVAVSSKGYARFRNAVAAMKSDSSFTYAGTLSFNLATDSYDTNNPTFKVYTSSDGTDWQSGWTEIFSTTYNDINSGGQDFSVEINSEEAAVFLKFESVNDDVDDTGSTYSFRLDNLELTDNNPDYLNETFDVAFIVTDLYNEVVEGAKVKLGETELQTDNNGEVKFTNQPYQLEAISYTVSRSDFPTRSATLFVKSNVEKKVVLVKQTLDIFLALGQSNMAGRGDIGDNIEPIDGAYLLDETDNWIPAMNPMNIYSNIRKDAAMQKLGPSYSFAKTMAKHIDKPVCIITNARGGTALSAFSEGGTYYEPMMERIKKANDYGKVKAVIWHQGESNSSKYANYLNNLNALVEDIRTAVDTNFYFLAGQLGGWGTKYELFNNNLISIKNSVSNADYVVNDRLWHIGDETHFNTPSQLLLGQRYAQKVLENVYGIKVAIYEFTFSDKLFVTNGDDTIHSGDRILYTTLWDEDLKLNIHARDEQSFTGLTINEKEINTVEGESVYEFKPDSRDTVFNIESTISTINKKENKGLSFYPNPAKAKVIFQGGTGTYSVTVSNLAGQLLIKETGKTEINIEALYTGIYLMHLQSGNKVIRKQLLIR